VVLGRDIVEAIIREHSHRRIAGQVLLIGEQVIDLGHADLIDLMREHRVISDSAATQSVSTGQGFEKHGRISAIELFRLLGVTDVRTLPVHGATGSILQDLLVPISDHLEGTADFIVDGGVLADAYSPASLLQNYARLLRAEGRLILINNMSSHFDPYSVPSAAWYLDYFVVNRFADCKVYVLVYFPDRQPNAFYLDIDCLLDPNREIRSFLSQNEMAVLVFAEKGEASTACEAPAHAHARSADEWQRYRQNLGRIKLGARPHPVRSRGRMADIDVRGGHLFMREDYTPVDVSTAKAEAFAAATATASADEDLALQMPD
jgi:hypothetical protein